MLLQVATRRKGELTGNTNLNLNHRATSLLYDQPMSGRTWPLGASVGTPLR